MTEVQLSNRMVLEEVGQEQQYYPRIAAAKAEQLAIEVAKER